MKPLSDLLLVIAAIASMAISALGFSVGIWGGFWGGTGVGAILNLLLWLLPALSVFAFAGYLISKSVGLICSWAIAIGWSICILASNQSAMSLFLYPLIQLIACIALYGDARIRGKSTQRLASKNEAR